MPFTIKPFKFQQKAVDDVLRYWETMQSVLLQSPPSSGKTVMAAMIISEIIKMAEYSNKRIFFFVHLEDLQKSTRKALSAFFSENKMVNSVGGRYGSDRIRQEAQIHIVMVQTFNSRFDRKNWKDYLTSDITSLCIFDECHRGEHDKVISYLRETSKEIKILGLTGTPKKTKGAKLPLHIAYDKKVNTVSEIELIDMKRTVPPYIILPEEQAESLELSTVPVQKSGFDKGEFKTGALSQHMRSKKYIYTGLSEIYKKHCNGLKMLVFCVDVEHAIEMTEKLNEKGVKTKFFASMKTKPKLAANATEKQVALYERRMEVYTKMVSAQRNYLTGSKESILSQWGRDFQALVNVGIFTTGFDDDNIMVIADAAPTMSENLYLQKEGRGKRIKDGKTFFYYIDLSESVKRFGHPCSPRDYPLYTEPKSKKKGEAPTKKCPTCGQSIPASDIICTAPRFDGFLMQGVCGHKFEKKRLERETNFTVIKFDEILGKNGAQAANALVKSSKTTVSDVMAYYESRSKSDKPISLYWFLFTVYEKFGYQGFIEYAESTQQDRRKYCEEVQKITDGRIAALDYYENNYE